MTIQAKQKLVADVSEEIGDFLTVTNTRRVSAILTEQLVQYDLEELRAETISNEALDVLQKFLDAKTVEGKSEKTVARYSYILEKALRSIGLPIGKITTHELRGYLMEEKERGLSDISLEGLRCVLSSFFGWVWKENIIPINPCANIGTIKCQKKIRLPYSATEVARLKDNCTSQRDKAMVCFMLATGARISEICGLNIDDVDMVNLECTVLGKGNKQRVVYLDEVAGMELQKYLDGRKDKSPALFAGKGTERITPHGVRRMLTVLGETAGVENVHPHRFRRTLATNLLNHGMALQEVSCILGHENLNTTMTYVYINQHNVKSSYKRYA